MRRLAVWLISDHLLLGYFKLFDNLYNWLTPHDISLFLTSFHISHKMAHHLYKDNVLRSPETYEELEVGRVPSLGHFVFQCLQDEHPKETIFADVQSGRSWTGLKLKEKIHDVAAALVRKLNLRPGDVCCISHDHSDETCILALAIIAAGAVVSCSYPKDPYAELLYLAERTQPRFLFCRRANLDWANQLRKDLGYDVTAVLMDANEDTPNCIAFKSLFEFDHKTVSDEELHLPHSCKDTTQEVAIIVMSSGTTGKPKAVPMTHHSLTAEIKTFLLKRGRGMSFASSASLDYVSGQLIILGAISAGYRAVIVNGFEPVSYLKAIQDYHINVVYLGAASFYSLITHPDFDKYDTSSLRVVFPMGAKILYIDELAEFFRKCPNIFQVKQAFGTSETAGVSMKNNTPDEYLKDCDNSGTLMGGVTVKIIQTESGKLCGPDERGMVHVKGPTVFPGYYDARYSKLSDKLARVDSNGNLKSSFIRDETIFDSEGYYISGDIGYYNQAGELYICGRQKELMVCRGAKKVIPQELEQIIEEHPQVAQVTVLGMPNTHEIGLHCPRAFIVAKSLDVSKTDVQTTRLHETLVARESGQEETLRHKGTHKLSSMDEQIRRLFAEDLMEFVNDRVGYEKQLTGGIVVLDQVPILRATGKVNKNYLRSLNYECVEIYGDRS